MKKLNSMNKTLKPRFDMCYKSNVAQITTTQMTFEDDDDPLTIHYEAYQDYKAAHAVEQSYEDLLDLEHQLK
jgi:hypothetical protein